jgi:hypothetical protein
MIRRRTAGEMPSTALLGAAALWASLTGCTMDEVPGSGVNGQAAAAVHVDQDDSATCAAPASRVATPQHASTQPVTQTEDPLTIVRPANNVTWGDFDADGLIDLVYGDSAGNPLPGCGAGTGAVYLRYGDAPGVEIAVPGSAPCGARRGAAVTAADVDADGHDDLIIGRPGADQVEWIRGGPLGLQTASMTIAAASSDGAAPSFGAALAGADLNCDGYEDVAVGLPDASHGGMAGAGKVAILSGSRTGLFDRGTRIGIDTHGLASPAAADHFGAILAADRFSASCGRLAIASPGRNVGAAVAAGTVHVLFATSAGLGSAVALTAASAGEVPSTGHRFGARMVFGWTATGGAVLAVPTEEGPAVFPIAGTTVSPGSIMESVEPDCIPGPGEEICELLLGGPSGGGEDECVPCCGPPDCCIQASCE